MFIIEIVQSRLEVMELSKYKELCCKVNIMYNVNKLTFDK